MDNKKPMRRKAAQTNINNSIFYHSFFCKITFSNINAVVSKSRDGQAGGRGRQTRVGGWGSSLLDCHVESKGAQQLQWQTGR